MNIYEYSLLIPSSHFTPPSFPECLSPPNPPALLALAPWVGGFPAGVATSVDRWGAVAHSHSVVLICGPTLVWCRPTCQLCWGRCSYETQCACLIDFTGRSRVVAMYATRLSIKLLSYDSQHRCIDQCSFCSYPNDHLPN